MQIHRDIDIHSGAAPEPADRVDTDPISPELILVSSPEVARKAREQLPPFPSYPPPNDDMTVVVNGPMSEPRDIPIPAPAALPETPTTRPRRRRWLAIAVAAVALAAVAAGVAIRERDVGRTSEAPAGSLHETPSRPTGTATTTSTRPGTPSSPPAKATGANAATGGATATSQEPLAGATTSAGIATTPAAARPQTAPAATPTPAFIPSRVFAWPAVAAASGYLVRFFRNGSKVYETSVRKPHLTLPPSFRFLAGRYRWEVLPIVGSDPTVHYGAPVVDSRFVVAAG